MYRGILDDVTDFAAIAERDVLDALIGEALDAVTDTTGAPLFADTTPADVPPLDFTAPLGYYGAPLTDEVRAAINGRVPGYFAQAALESAEGWFATLFRDYVAVSSAYNHLDDAYTDAFDELEEAYTLHEEFLGDLATLRAELAAEKAKSAGLRHELDALDGKLAAAEGRLAAQPATVEQHFHIHVDTVTPDTSAALLQRMAYVKHTPTR